MDIIAQLQEQANKIAFLTFTTVGTFQRDAPPAQVSKDYSDPAPAPSAEDLKAFAEQPKAMAAALVQAAKQVRFPFFVIIVLVCIIRAFANNDRGVDSSMPWWRPFR